MMSMSDETFRRFKKVCGMLGSSFDGERAVAAERATEMLRSNNMTWEDVLQNKIGGSQYGNSGWREKPSDGWSRRSDYGNRSSGAHVADAQNILARVARLSEWEREFLENIQNFVSLSEKQQACFEKIKQKYSFS